jgi:hypothetical protein
MGQNTANIVCEVGSTLIDGVLRQVRPPVDHRQHRVKHELLDLCRLKVVLGVQ